MKIPAGMKIRLDPEDEYQHTPEAAKNYNESMYFNMFDHGQKMGGWFRIGNRPNEGYAEMSVCLYLPDGRVAFMFGRPEIKDNSRMAAGGLEVNVIEPFKKLRVSYDGKACVLANPHDMADPKSAFKNNPHLDVKFDLDYQGISPVHGGELVHEDGTPQELDPEKAFLRGHYEQHMAAQGTIKVGGDSFTLSGYGIRDKSWGPRFWQAIYWYRWLPMSFGPDLALVPSITCGEGAEPRVGGMVFTADGYDEIVDATLDAIYDSENYQTGMHIVCKTAKDTYDITGKVISLIPLRNRRKTPNGDMMNTRITEGMTEYTCNGRTGYGLSEFLDQVVDGIPVGLRTAAE